MNIKPRGNTFIVTGGGSGIGFAIASLLVNEGCKVLIIGRNKEKLYEAKEKMLSDHIYIYQYDISEVESFTKVICESEILMGGHIDGVINCAGIATKAVGQPGINESINAWNTIIDVDLKAPVFLTRCFALYLKENGIAGNILNISSAQGCAAKTVSAYQMAKSNLIKFTRGIAKDFAKFNIVINGIAPGVTYSNMTPRPRSGINQCKLHANGRVIEPIEIAWAALFLLSPCGNSIIGDTLMVDGGFLSAI